MTSAPSHTAPPPFLTDEEVYEICRPRRQGAAQLRYLLSIGVKAVRRADGTPLVWRCDVDGSRGNVNNRASVQPRWTTITADPAAG